MNYFSTLYRSCFNRMSSLLPTSSQANLPREIKLLETIVTSLALATLAGMLATLTLLVFTSLSLTPPIAVLGAFLGTSILYIATELLGRYQRSLEFSARSQAPKELKTVTR